MGKWENVAPHNLVMFLRNGEFDQSEIRPTRCRPLLLLSFVWSRVAFVLCLQSFPELFIKKDSTVTSPTTASSRQMRFLLDITFWDQVYFEDIAFLGQAINRFALMWERERARVSEPYWTKNKFTLRRLRFLLLSQQSCNFWLYDVGSYRLICSYWSQLGHPGILNSWSILGVSWSLTTRSSILVLGSKESQCKHENGKVVVAVAAAFQRLWSPL